MAYSIFETRQRAEEMLAEAVAIWRQSNNADNLEGLEKDPVFSMLLSAVAYQANEIDNDLERIKQDVIDDYAAALMPYDLGRATPASVAVTTLPADGIAEIELSSSTLFYTAEEHIPLMPLMKTRVLNVSVEDVTRLDGRRWAVSFQFREPITDLSGFTFAINNKSFRDLIVTVDDKELPLIRPWEYGEMPMNECFATENAVYNHSAAYSPSLLGMDLFARHDLRMYCVKKHNPSLFLKSEQNVLNLVFEFTDVTEDFTFSASQITPNVVLLANVVKNEATLDGTNPVVRVGENSTSGTSANSQFMFLLRPNEEQIYSMENVSVRRVMADRFNQASLIKLLSSLIGKLKSDFYAFQYMKTRQSAAAINGLIENLQKLLTLSRGANESHIAGTYLMLHPGSTASITLSYLTTSGSGSNSYMTGSIIAPPGFQPYSTQTLAAPVQGTDEVSSEGACTELIRYAIATNDRIVTPADIRAFCYNQLHSRYSITREQVKSFSVKQQLQSPDSRWHNASGFEIAVDIVLSNSNYVKRSFASSIPQAEIVLEKMMQVRSVNIYPITVNIRIE